MKSIGFECDSTSCEYNGIPCESIGECRLRVEFYEDGRLAMDSDNNGERCDIDSDGSVYFSGD